MCKQIAVDLANSVCQVTENVDGGQMVSTSGWVAKRFADMYRRRPSRSSG